MAVKNEQGHWIDGRGNPIPTKYIDPIDKAQDKLVSRLIKQATAVSEKITKLRDSTFQEIDQFMADMEARYDVKVKTAKGNKSLTDFSHTLKVEIATANLISFDERLKLAKALIDDCIKRWSKDSNDNLKVLVDDAFKVDKKGNLDKDRILSLRNVKIKDADWKKAMEIITDSIKVVGSKQYIRFWQKRSDGGWESIPLDIARG